MSRFRPPLPIASSRPLAYPPATSAAASSLRSCSRRLRRSRGRGEREASESEVVSSLRSMDDRYILAMRCESSMSI